MRKNLFIKCPSPSTNTRHPKVSRHVVRLPNTARYVSRKRHNGISDRSSMATGSGTTVSRVWGISTGRENAQEMKLSIAEALRDLKQVQCTV
jgi:hypothetical protein